MEAGGKQVYILPAGRIIGFDFLRSIALFLTLCRHSFSPDTFLWQIGWAGVYLFFVLSSFLIANILFTEYYKTGKIRYLRFFVRRSLKIYPLYYLFILISVLKNKQLLLTSLQYKWQLTGQLFHLQNYTGTLWYHTWSLAAEEHFYTGICILLILYTFISKAGSLRGLAWIFLAIVVLAPLLRYRATLLYHTDWFMGTHFIMDSFAWGALLALGKFEFPEIFSTVTRLKHWLLFPIFILLIPLFLLPAGNTLMNSIGLSMMLLAFTLMLCFLLSAEYFCRESAFISRWFLQPLASVGIASYSIYLFHVPVKTIIDSINLYEWMRIPAYFTGCILAGKISWYLIEKPIASYKSRFFSA